MNFTPQAGREQAGHRPALVLTARAYNAASGVMLACPLSSHVKGYPFEVALRAGKPLPHSGAVLCDQIRSVDWSARGLKYAAQMPRTAFARVMEKVGLLLELGGD